MNIKSRIAFCAIGFGVVTAAQAQSVSTVKTAAKAEQTYQKDKAKVQSGVATYKTTTTKYNNAKSTVKKAKTTGTVLHATGTGTTSSVEKAAAKSAVQSKLKSTESSLSR